MRVFIFVGLLCTKFFHAYEKINKWINKTPSEAFSTLDAYKNISDLNGLKCEQNQSMRLILQSKRLSSKNP